MNILLVRPKPHKDTINLQSFMICEPLELEYAAAKFTLEGHTVDIVDLIIEKKSLLWFLKQKKYDKVGFTCYLPTANIVKKYAELVKSYDKNIITFVGGIVAEVTPEYLKSNFIDELVTKTALPDYLPMREKTAKYRQNYNYIFHEGCATLKTSYGCPYNCEFCFCAAITGGRYFVRSMPEVISEIATISEDKIFIVDDNFLFDTARLNHFCNLIKEHKIVKEFIVFGRTDFVADEKNHKILCDLYDCGLRAVFMGLESFKQDELVQMNKLTSVDCNIKAVKKLESLNINAYLGIIVGYDWVKADFDNLINHLKEFQNPFINVQPILPLKGTPLYEKLKSQISLSESRLEHWDMAHLALKPSNMSVRKFYYNIVRIYVKTILTKSVRTFIKKKYGKTIYKRVKSGATKIFFQYLRLIIKGKIE